MRIPVPPGMRNGHHKPWPAKGNGPFGGRAGFCARVGRPIRDFYKKGSDTA